jgi:hypothetical protein
VGSHSRTRFKHTSRPHASKCFASVLGFSNNTKAIDAHVGVGGAGDAGGLAEGKEK